MCVCVCVFSGAKEECVQYHPAHSRWPDPDCMRSMPFDYTIHDPKYEDISSVYCPDYTPSTDGRAGLASRGRPTTAWWKRDTKYQQSQPFFS